MKIHLISNSLRMNSGFSIVTRHIAKGLKKFGHEITMTGMQTAYISEWSYGIEVLPIQVYYIDDITQYMMTLDRIKPDVVIAIFQMDMGDNNPFVRIFPKTIIYSPVEGRDIPLGMANDLINVIKAGGKVVSQCFYGSREMDKVGIENTCIYHGYDQDIFRPLDLKKMEDVKYCYYGTEDGKVDSDPLLLHRQGCYDCLLNNKEQTSCQYYKEENVAILRFINGKWTEENVQITNLPSLTKGKWIFGFVGQNIGVRKRIERLLGAYSIFVKGSKQLKDRTILHLHTKPIAIDGINLIKVIQDLDIQNNVIFSYGTHRSSGWTEEAMNILYNTFDAHVSASSSEGYGLGTLESMACGKPNVGPDCSSFTELIGKTGNNKELSKNRGLLADIESWQMIQDCSVRALVNELDLANRMKDIYQNKDMYKIYSKNAEEWSKQYTWDKICIRWNELLKNMKI